MMLKLLFRILRKAIVASLLIYSFDVLAGSIGFSIPINLTTVILVSMFDFLALFCLIVFSVMF